MTGPSGPAGVRPARTPVERVGRHTRAMTDRAHAALRDIPGLTVYGPPPGAPRSPLLAFNLPGVDPMAIAAGLDEHGIESRAGCHCATLAHRELGLTPPTSCRLSFALYTSAEDVDRATEALRRVTARRPQTAVRAQG